MEDKISKERLRALKNEIIMAEALNKEELEPMVAEALERYTGVHVPHFGVDWDIVLNEVYPIIQNNLPSIFFRNPRAFLKPRNKTYIAKRRNPMSGQMDEVQLDSSKSARTQEAILNYTIEEIKYKKEARTVLLDALLFPHGVLWHGYKGDFGMTEEQSFFIKDDSVFVKRISPLRFLKDPAVSMSGIEEAKWVGRAIDIPLIDLIEDDKLDVDKSLIKGFKGFGDKIKNDKIRDFMQKGGVDKIAISRLKTPLIDVLLDQDFKDSPFAHFVRVFEIYLRPTKREKREGKKGWILLLTKEQEKPLRVNDWKTKAEGFPSILLQFNELPDTMFGLPDIDTYKQAADQKNVIVNLQLRNAQEHTKTWVGISKGGTSEEDIQKVQTGQNTIILFEGDINPKDRMFVASPGGASSSELYLIDQRIQQNLEDKSGVTDLKRGFLKSGEESAASVKLRAAGGGARPAYRQDIMSDFLGDSFRYLNQLNRQFMPIKEAVRIIGSLDLEWSDNPSKEEIQAEVDVELDAISMLPENPEREIRELNTVLMLMVQALTEPTIRQKIAQEGKTMNLSPMIEQILLRMRIRDPDIFRNIKPEESQGFVSVAEIRAAKQNVQAALSGQSQVPSPPAMEQDHVARIEVYTTVLSLIKGLGDNIATKIITQLVQIHQALIQEAQKKQAQPGQKVTLPKPRVETVGTR